MYDKKYEEKEYKNPEYRLAKAYVPYQKMCKVYDLKEALCKGTLFLELYMPYEIHDRKKRC